MIYIIILISIAIYTMFLIAGSAFVYKILYSIKLKIIAIIMCVLILGITFAIGFCISRLPLCYYYAHIDETESDNLEIIGKM